MAGRRRKLVDPHPGECELRTDLGPFRQAAHALEVRACRGGGHEPGGGQPVEHDERVVRASAQALGTSKEEHQLGTARRAFLHGAPRQVVKALVFVTRRGVERLLAAFLPVLALRLQRGCRCLNRQADGKHQVERNVRQQHRNSAACVALQGAAEIEHSRAGKIRVGILGGLSQATGGVASNQVKQTRVTVIQTPSASNDPSCYSRFVSIRIGTLKLGWGRRTTDGRRSRSRSR